MNANAKNAVDQKVKLAKGDLVRVIAGKDRGGKSEGRIIKIDRARRRIMAEGLNIVKKAKKPQREGEQGEIIEVEAYMDISNVMIVCSGCGPTRVGYKGEGRKKERICRKCGKAL
ncbi:50S ribosomal protein L24 [Candidatus Haliotispira prima]|uniref:Large ribosomal subunit protein uL24 n=1 Tax=Candidatus Haliotispira prima TaxID=3034016 RepID=A0ABY8MFZ3_9SPIO|nr:50S ribosomal protein L24 [Candidatus Haliotispira prima]